MTRKIKKSCHVHKDQDYEECLTLLDNITNEFLQQGYLDDEGYLRGMITSLRRSGKSRKEIMAKLMQKQIKPDDIQNALEQYDTENNDDPVEAEFHAALKFARKKRLGPYDKIEKYEQEKTLNMFARKGFNYDTARRVMMMSLDDVYELG